MKILAINPNSFKKKNDRISVWYSFILQLSTSVFRFDAYLHHLVVPRVYRSEYSGCVFPPLFITLMFTFLDYKNDGSFAWEVNGTELVYTSPT